MLSLLFKKWLPELMGVIALSAFLAHTGWHWFLDRGSDLLEYDFGAPAASGAMGATLMRWLMLALIVVGTLWVLRALYGWMGRRFDQGAEAPSIDA